MQNCNIKNFILQVFSNDLILSLIKYCMRKLSVFLILVLALPIFLFGCNSSKDDEISHYSIVGSYDENLHALTCEQTLVYQNKSDNALSEIKFFLYANSFNEGNKVVSTSSQDKAYPNGESFGNIEIKKAMSEGKDTNFSLNEEKSILTVSLDAEIFPDEEVEIYLSYIVNLANINHRLGYGNNTINFGNFYPIVCVYENGFVENEFASNGDPFYSDIANYDVEISYDAKYTFVSSGNVVKETSENGKKTTCINGEKLRDFCFVLSEKFEVISQEINGVKVNYYYYDDPNAEEYLELSCLVIDEFSTMFGEYPYDVVNVVKINFCFGGMEYPNLVYISDAIIDAETYRYVIVHELAHQWWYSLVGNNEFQEAWLDESLTEYSTALFFEKHSEFGLKYEDIILGAENTYRMFVDVYESVNGEVGESMNRSLKEFATEPEYVNCVYTKGVLMYDSLRKTLGDKKFFKCLSEYFDAYCYKNAKGEDLIDSFSKTAKINLESFFDAFLSGEVILDN